ncbi:hypothetical protein, partial [Staphylococcus epidermidis]|uniref:hypothetical protein n=1 Tax=Staphylococcus epidermidis TaxID=1282 RepID=UPI001643204B
RRGLTNINGIRISGKRGIMVNMNLVMGVRGGNLMIFLGGKNGKGIDIIEGMKVGMSGIGKVCRKGVSKC